MKVLAFLQNQWFRDHDHVREILKRRPEARRRIIHYSLFAGCRTGRILKAGLGEEWCRKIVWEEASPEIGGYASSVFPADPEHMIAVIREVQPTVILALGKIAQDALKASATRPPVIAIIGDNRVTVFDAIELIVGPHPTARGVDTLSVLRGIRADLERREAA